jgi:poly-gamma-glutamate capsule biosynthesis protein CapA/YwtB (metallophosphatase superfamily)
MCFGSRAASRLLTVSCVMATLFVCGDVMTGRGIDQIQRYSCPPEIHEPYARRARLRCAGRRGQRSHPASGSSRVHLGDALDELERVGPDARIINLETSITTNEEFWRGKGIHYRMHPANIGCLTAARVDVCVLANNHVLDYGRAGLDETIVTLTGAGLKVAGAGASIDQARKPAIVNRDERGRILVFAVAAENSGVPKTWAATATSSGSIYAWSSAWPLLAVPAGAPQPVAPWTGRSRWPAL